MCVCPPPRIKLLEKPAWGLCRGHLEPTCSWWHPPSRSIRRLAGNAGEGPFGHPLRSCREGASPPQIHGASCWPGHPLWLVFYTVLSTTAAVPGARRVPGSPPSSIRRSQPGPMLLMPTWGWDLAWGGSRGHGSPPRSALSLSRLFVCLSCPVPPHWSVSTEVGRGTWSFSDGPRSRVSFSSWLCLSCALQGSHVWGGGRLGACFLAWFPPPL